MELFVVDSLAICVSHFKLFFAIFISYIFICSSFQLNSSHSAKDHSYYYSHKKCSFRNQSTQDSTVHLVLNKHIFMTV